MNGESSTPAGTDHLCSIQEVLWHLVVLTPSWNLILFELAFCVVWESINERIHPHTGMKLHFKLGNIAIDRNSISFAAPAFLETNPNHSLILNWLSTMNNNLQSHGNPQPKQSFFSPLHTRCYATCSSLWGPTSLHPLMHVPVLNHLLNTGTYIGRIRVWTHKNISI